MSDTQASGKTVAILVFPGVNMLELTGIYSTLNGLKMAKYDVFLVAERNEPLQSDTPLKVVPHKSITEVPRPNILAVLGGGLSSLKAISNRALREYILSAVESADLVIGYGTGSVMLAAGELLKGRPAATHWAFSGLIEAFGAKYVTDRWVEEGKLITTAGGTAGMDMNLGLLARLAGEKNARMLQLFAEYDPQPPFGGIDWSQVKRNGLAPFQQGEVQAFKRSLTAEPAGEPEVIHILQAWADGLVQAEGI